MNPRPDKNHYRLYTDGHCDVTLGEDILKILRECTKEIEAKHKRQMIINAQQRERIIFVGGPHIGPCLFPPSAPKGSHKGYKTA